MTSLSDRWPGLRRSIARGKLRDAARLGVQSAAAATATLFLLAFIEVDEAFLGVISAVFVLDPSRDATVGNAIQRIVATVIGTLVGGIGLLLSPQGELASMAVVMLLMGSIAAIKPQWRYGLVAAAGLALGSDAQVWETAANRTIAIFAGAAIGIAAGLLIWPKTARGFAVEHLREALATSNELLRRTLALAVEGSDAEVSALHRQFSRQIERASAASQSVRLTQGSEKRRLSEVVHQTQRLWHALIIVDRVTETKSAGPVVDEERRRQVRRLKEQCCEAMSRLQRLEPVEDGCLEAIDRSGVELDLLNSEGSDSNRVERFGLTYGLHEVVRNIRELSDAIADLRGQGN